jgi:hypothetical protein
MRAFRTLIHHCWSLRFEYSLQPPSLSSFRHAPPNTTLLLRDLQIVASPLHIALWPSKTNRPAVPMPSAIYFTARFTCPALNAVGPQGLKRSSFPSPYPPHIATSRAPSCNAFSTFFKPINPQLALHMSSFSILTVSEGRVVRPVPSLYLHDSSPSLVLQTPA